jgi:membrane protease YdiL (CAAX protease family)
MEKRIVVILEIAVAFLLILAQIWFVGKLLSFFTLLPLALIAASWLVHRDNAESLGLKRFQFAGYGSLWIILGGGAVVVMILGVSVNRQVLWKQDVVLGLPLRFVAYLAPALFQQIILNGFFVNRMHTLVPNRITTALLCGLLFCSIHAPNPVLVPLTLLGGTVCSYYFLRNRNLYPLALGHAALAAVAFCFLPQAWHHQFRVGMEYYLYIPKPGDCCMPDFLKVFLQ